MGRKAVGSIEISQSESGFWNTENSSTDAHAFDDVISSIINEFVEKNNPSLVYDFGCGYGEYLKKISDMGVEAIGFEGNPDRRFYNNIVAQDLSRPFTLQRKADISISLEVGEHIPAEFEKIFIDNICNNSKDIVFLSWAVEGQAGHGHVNCKNNDYIIDQMFKRGFFFIPDSLELRKNAEMGFFKNTFMIFQKK